MPPTAASRCCSRAASELEREFPFGVVRQLFESVVTDPERREQALAGAAAPAAAVFGEAAMAEGDASFAALHGLFWVALNLAAEGPLVLAIDDLHWCDRPSLRFVAYLARRLEGQPILVAATIRSGEPGTDVALLGEIAHDPSTIARPPGPLSADAVRALVRERLGAGGRRRVLRRLPRGDRRQPAAPAPAADRARGRRRQARRRARRRRAGHRAARGVADGDHAARAAAADAIAVARARRRAGRERDLPAVAALTGLSEARVADGDRRARPGRDPAPRGADRVRPRAGARRGLPGARRSASASSSTSARRACCSTRARRRAGRRPPARRAAARAGVGGRALPRGGPRGGEARRAGERASPISGARSKSRPRPRGGRSYAASSGSRRS